MKKILLYLFIINSLSFAQMQTPLEANNYNKLTSYNELKSFVNNLDETSDLLAVEVIDVSVEGRNIFALKFSNSEFGKDDTKVKVLIFAQQHGDEQSGKEGALLLAKELLKDENKYLFDKIDFTLVPQVNPDGSEVDKRRNANGADLNRNHLILTEPETIALHNLFNEYLFDLTCDVHEYYPYSKSWNEFGYYKRADEQLGLTSNLNVSEIIRSYSKENVLPFVRDYLDSKRFSFCEYVVGGPPNLERIRHSTVDINDGRQSLGILNTLSFIIEGKNGRDSIDNIQHRAIGQYNAMMSLLKFAYENAADIKSLVKDEREKINLTGYPVIIRMEHYPDGSSFNLPVTNVENNIETEIEVTNYHPLVKKLLEVTKPDAYLIPSEDSLLISFLQKHDIKYTKEIPPGLTVQQYEITAIDSIELEGEKMIDVKVEVSETKTNELMGDYVLITTSQLRGNLITIALEPQSMLGLINYPQYEYLRNQEKFPILRMLK